MEKIKGLLEKHYIKINKIIIYFLLLSMSLFLSTDYFPIVEVCLVFIGIYIMSFCAMKKFKPLIEFIKSPFFIWYASFWVLVIAITALRNAEQMMILIKTIIAFSAYIFGFGILYSDKETRKSIDICKVFEVVAVVICIWILVFEYELLFQGERIGYSVMIGNPNSAASLLSIFVFFIIFKTKKTKSVKDLLALLLCIMIIFATGSKKAIVVVAIALMMFLFKNGQLVKKRLLYFGIATVIAIAVCFMVPVLYDNVARRFLSLFGELGIINFRSDHSSELRTQYTDKAIELWKNNIIFGGGYDNFRINSGYATYSHNNYVELLSSVGIVGTIYYYAYYIYLLAKQFVKKNMQSVLCILFIVSTLISDVGSVIFSTYPMYYIMLMILGKEIEHKDIEEETSNAGQKNS